MLVPFLTLLLISAPVQTPVPAEPDGSRTVGVVPPFHGDPAPPEWLRPRSHAAADPDCRHYVYEAYAGTDHWLARYVMLPEGDEAFRDIEQVFLFTREGRESHPISVPPGQVAFTPSGARWRKESFHLVDRRDLMKP